jgi:putative nucleotidyltransferase with HDIG domain
MEAALRHPVSFRRSKAVAALLVARRREIRQRLLDAVAPPDEQSLVLHALSDGLIEQFVRAAERRTWSHLLQWVEAICSRRPRPAVRRLFQSFVPVLAETLELEGLDELSASLLRVLERAARKDSVLAQPAPSLEIVDEIDLLCSEMLQRIESNDPKTAEHCRAVSAWCARIARRMSLTRAEITLVARGGLIHDVGKSKVPAEILNAPRRLSDEEMDIIRTHAVLGYEMVQAYPKLADLAGLVRSHHERFDGDGYPDRLDRTRIPIHVRIVSVADTFNAMIGRRPYRAPFSPSRAIAELQRCAGTQLDPDVVRALLDVISGAKSSEIAA